MSIAVDTSQQTGLVFIDASHPIIAAFINTICEDLQMGKKPIETISMLESLKDQVESHQDSKHYCCVSHSKSCKDAPTCEALAQLNDLTHIYSRYSDTLAPQEAITILGQWARKHVFEKDLRCLTCAT